MVPLGLGQAILGGSNPKVYQNRLYHYTCSQRVCQILELNQKLQNSRINFVAIPIPDAISGCISESKIPYCF